MHTHTMTYSLFIHDLYNNEGQNKRYKDKISDLVNAPIL